MYIKICYTVFLFIFSERVATIYYCSTVTVALFDFAAVPTSTASSPKMPTPKTSKWGDLSNLPFRIQWLKKIFKSKTVAVLYGFLTQRFVYHHLCVCN